MNHSYLKSHRSYNDLYLSNKYILNSNYCNYTLNCNQCNNDKIRGFCNMCKTNICCNKRCCELFPHYQNTVFVICKCCISEIEKKLYILEDNNSLLLCKQDLRILKEKIKNKKYKINKNL